MINISDHPMHVNFNTRLRWEDIRKLPLINSLPGKKTLDIGSGLGYFVACFHNLGADILATDVDANSLKYIRDAHSIDTFRFDVNSDPMPEGLYDFIYIGEVLEHIADPETVIGKIKLSLAESGSLLITTPAMEGIFINTKGKSLCHDEGSEKHERDGFYYKELEQIISNCGMKITHHSYSIFFIGELLMQLSKAGYSMKKRHYHSQADMLEVTNTLVYKVWKFLFPIALTLAKLENILFRALKLKGHCHIIICEIDNGE